jgi:hypothetical protein
VIYLEDPETALPIVENPEEQTFFEVGRGENPLEVADRLGRPMAILRMGGRVPDAAGPDAAFLYGSPPFLKYFTGGEQMMGEPCDPLSISKNTPSRGVRLSRAAEVVRAQNVSQALTPALSPREREKNARPTSDDVSEREARSSSKLRRFLPWGNK